MNDQKDLDFINDKLYSLDIPNESLKKIMFYFSVLKNVIDFRFPPNFLNYEHPYFKSYNRMEEFLSLARSLNPEFLHQNNAIIYHNDKKFYKYYQTNNDEDGVPYEFKIIDNQESSNPIFKSNYKNTFNISNINPKQTKFDVVLTNKVDFPHSEDSAPNTYEDFYFDYENNFEPDNLDRYYSFYENSQEPVLNYNEIQDYFDENEIQKNERFAIKSFMYSNQMNSIDELEESEENLSDSISATMFYDLKIDIVNKLVASNNWIDFIYNQPIKDLLFSMKKVIKEEDVIRSKSISLPKNIFYYLEIALLALLIVCSVMIICYSVSLKNDELFFRYEGRNESDMFFPILSKSFDTNFLNRVYNIDYSNESVIIADPKKHKKALIGCQMAEVSGFFGIFFFIFVIYMVIRVCRENTKKYQKRELKNEVGLNMCHIVLLFLFTILAVIITLVSEILLIIPVSMKTYAFVHNSIRTQLILNSIMFVSYFLIQIFHFKI